MFQELWNSEAGREAFAAISSDKEPVLNFVRHNDFQRVSRIFRTGPNLPHFPLTLANSVLLRLPSIVDILLDPAKSPKISRDTISYRAYVPFPLTNAIAYLLHIAMADRGVRNLEGNLS
jgi:hypothetical protein